VIVSNGHTLVPMRLDLDRIRRQADALQRKGMTLTEIAIELSRPRKLIVDILYNQKVRS
jgi:hypothetical protein